MATKYFYLHGFASSINSLKAQYFKQKFHQQNINLELLDLNLNDFKNLTITKQINYVLTKLSKYDEVILVGSSLGGLISLNVAEVDKRIKKVILFAPALECKDSWPDMVGLDKIQKWQTNGKLPIFLYNENIYLDLDYNFIIDLEKMVNDRDFLRQLPVLLFHGIFDETVPFKVSENYIAKNKLAKLCKLEDDHSLEKSLDYMWSQILDFL